MSDVGRASAGRRPALHALAEHLGIVSAYRAAGSGELRETSDGTREALLLATECFPIRRCAGKEGDDLLGAQTLDWIGCVYNQSNAIKGKGRRRQSLSLVVA